MHSRIPVLAAALLVVVASGCTYGSRMEARAACQKWLADGGKATYPEKYPSFTIRSMVEKRERWIRSCEFESETSQYLGLSPDGLNPGDIIETREEVPESRVVKRFRYPSR